MKPFSTSYILKDTCNNNSFKRKGKQSLCQMKKAPKKPVLKPFWEQKSPTLPQQHDKTITEGMESPLPSLNAKFESRVKLGGGLVRAFGDCCSPRPSWREQNKCDCSRIYNLHIQLRRRQKELSAGEGGVKAQPKEPAGVQKKNRSNNEPKRRFSLRGGDIKIWADGVK